MVPLELSESHGTCLSGAEVVKGTATARATDTELGVREEISRTVLSSPALISCWRLCGGPS